MRSLYQSRAGGFGLANSRGLRVALICVLLAVFASLAHAQEATIVGAVTDPTGAAVANAAIAITNTETGFSRQITSNEVGQFVVPGLRIGHYTIKVEAKGFKSVEQNDLVLNVGDRRALDFKLQLGTATEKVTVESTTIAVQTESGENGHVITDEQVAQIPANGRSIYAMVALVPGASSNMPDAQVPVPVGGDATVSFNGQRQAHNIYLIDGGENLDRGGAGTLSVMPSVDAIQEFRAMTSNYSAEYGLSSAATMTMVIKSGVKRFHAGAWEYLRNDALDATPWFNGGKKQWRRFNVYGFNVSGPVEFTSKDPKTFFFYNMEWRKQVLGGSTNQIVPPASAYTGNLGSTGIHVPDFSLLSAAEQKRFTDLGLTSGGAFPSNTIPTALLDANAQSLLKAGIFPAPNGLDSKGNPVFQGGNKAPTDVREEIARVDHRFNDKISVFGHWISEQILQTYGTSMWSGDNVPTIGNTFGNPSYSAVAHLTHMISPTLLNEVAFNYNGNRINILNTGVYKAPSDFKFDRIFTGPNANSRIPSINLSGTTTANYTANWIPWTNKADDYQIRDDVSWTKGAHQLKMGASYALYKKAQDVFASTQGNFSFNGNFTGNDFADFLLGYASGYNEAAVMDKGHWNNISWAAYFQDNWRATKRLTLNLGLRWDGVPHTYEADKRMSNFYPNLYDLSKAAVLAPGGNEIDPSRTNSAAFGTSPNPLLSGVQFYLNGIGIAGQPGVPKGMTKDQWAAFGPRIGFAYDLTGAGKTVVRGGFGTMYERVQGNDMYQGGTNSPFSATVNYSNVMLKSPKASTNGTTIANPIPIVGITGISLTDYKLPTVYQYSLGVEQGLGKSVLSVAYVGAQGRHQNYWRDINVPTNPTPALLASLAEGKTNLNNVVPYSGFGSIKMAENGQNTHYNSLQVSFRGTVKSDLDYQVAYTFSRSVDPTTGNGGNGTDLNSSSNPYDLSYDVGPSLLDRTHVFVANYMYRLPFFKNSSNRALKTAFGGWQISGVTLMQTGIPLVMTLGGTYAANGLPNAVNRPQVNGDISTPHTRDSWMANTVTWVDPNDPKHVNGFISKGPFVNFCNFAGCATPGTWGNNSPHSVRGPGRDNWNMALVKDFTFSEERGSRLQFRAEFFNVWNHTQFNAVSSNLSSSNFGQVTSCYNPRELQLGLKLFF